MFSSSLLFLCQFHYHKKGILVIENLQELRKLHFSVHKNGTCIITILCTGFVHLLRLEEWAFKFDRKAHVANNRAAIGFIDKSTSPFKI